MKPVASATNRPATTSRAATTLIALTRPVPPSITACELTHIARVPIDHARAAEQHRRYEECLTELGCSVRQFPATPHLPDSVFVEDAAVVFPEMAVITRPGAASRRAETESVAEALALYRPLSCLQPPATLDGGDVLVAGRSVYVGLSERTNGEGVRQLQGFVAPYGYVVHTIAVRGCLHLKTAACAIAVDKVLVNPDWVDADNFKGLETLVVHSSEPFAANALRIGETLVYASTHQRTREMLARRGIRVTPVDVDELAKAEAGVTCCSLLVSVG